MNREVNFWVPCKVNIATRIMVINAIREMSVAPIAGKGDIAIEIDKATAAMRNIFLRKIPCISVNLAPDVTCKKIAVLFLFS